MAKEYSLTVWHRWLPVIVIILLLIGDLRLARIHTFEKMLINFLKTFFISDGNNCTLYRGTHCDCSAQVKRASFTEMVRRCARRRNPTTATCKTSCGERAVDWYSAVPVMAVMTWTMSVSAREFHRHGEQVNWTWQTGSSSLLTVEGQRRRHLLSLLLSILSSSYTYSRQVNDPVFDVVSPTFSWSPYSSHSVGMTMKNCGTQVLCPKHCNIIFMFRPPLEWCWRHSVLRMSVHVCVHLWWRIKSLLTWYLNCSSKFHHVYLNHTSFR